MATRDLVGDPWWSPRAGVDPHARLIPLIHSIQRQQAQRYYNMRRMIGVYEGGYAATIANAAIDAINETRLHENMAKNAIDTLLTQVCVPKIAPMLLTKGGNYFEQKRAKEATQALEGILDECGFEEIKEDVVLDSFLSYNGFVKVSSEVEDGHGRIILERLSPLDVYVDEAEGRYRAPRCLYTRRMVDRHVLMAEYGKPDPDLYGSADKRRAAIRKAKAGSDFPEEYIEQTDMIQVWEAWHLPPYGMHAIAIDGCTLYVDEWKRPCFPVFSYRPEKSRIGYWGLSVMGQIISAQREYERVTEKLQRSHKRLGGTGLIVNKAVKVNVRELGNGVAQLIEVDGDPNSAVAPFLPMAANPETYQYRENISANMLKVLGISNFAAQSEIPAGLQQASGKALHVFQDTENKRLIVKHRTLERFIIDVCYGIIDEVVELVDRGVDMSARHRAKRGFEAIQWSQFRDIIADRNNFIVTMFPVSMLAQTPAARLAQVQAMFAAGAISMEQFKRLSGIPDLDAELDIDCADYEIIDDVINTMIAKNVYLSPQPTDNLELIVQRGTKYVNHFRVHDVPDELVSLVRRYITDAVALMPPPPEAAPMPAGDMVAA